MEYKVFKPGEASVDLVARFIKDMDKLFIPTLSSRVDLDEYAAKMCKNATMFSYLEDGEIVALSVAYINKAPLESFGTYLAVHPDLADTGIGLVLTVKNIKYAEKMGSASFRVKIRASNEMLYRFYVKQGFVKTKEETYPNSDIIEYEMVKRFVGKKE